MTKSSWCYTASGERDDQTQIVEEELDAMRRHIVIIACVCVALLHLTGLTVTLVAGERQMTDLRERSYTSEELGQALFPMSVRGIPKPGSSPAAETSVALDVLFEFNSAAILPKYHAALDKLGTVLTAPQYTAYRVQVEGHTDDVGSEAYNQSLSQRRAQSVQQYLVTHFNIDPERLVVKGMGETQPVMPNDTDAGRRKNRRVEVVNSGL